jgi:hypothetical protein
MRGQLLLLPSIAAIALGLALPANAADIGTGEPQLVPPVPGWNIGTSLDLVYATREPGDDNIILQDTITGRTILDADDFGFDWEPGLDARLNVTNGNIGGGVRFFGGFKFDDTQKLDTPTIWNFPTIPPLFALGAAAVTSTYETSLDSVELNVAKLFGPHISLFAGVRSVMLDDKLTTVAKFIGNTATVTFEADTFAIGPQLGGEFHYGDRLFVEGDARIGALVASSDFSMGVRQDFGAGFSAFGDDSDWIAVAEGGIAAGFRVGRSTSLRAGYRVLYINDVPTATAIVDKTELLPLTRIEASSDDILIHAVTAGVKITF